MASITIPPRSARQIREDFIRFFEERGHQRVRSAPVVPLDDPTLLFANAGMNQFKDVFLQEGSRPYRRAVDSQKCIRASGKHNDLEDVGRDHYHHTFFEMLGNWSFGDYFKREAIRWAWELLVDVWGLPPERLHVTVFSGNAAEGVPADTEAEKLWLELTPLPPERVLRFGKKDNFWEMGEVGPCGPCSEVHIDLGADYDRAGVRTGVNVEGSERFIELWNLVFIQYNRHRDGTLQPLPAQHVDTGLGLERITRVLQGKRSNYDTDLFMPLIKRLAALSGEEYGRHAEKDVAFRVIVDHLRSLCFALADGALPSNEGRGYVLRRMLRRATRFGRLLGFTDPFLHRLIPTLVTTMGEAYPELQQQQQHIAHRIEAEETHFSATLDRGLLRFAEAEAEQLRRGAKQISGEQAFRLYDTFGFPLDLTELLAAEKGLSVDRHGFEGRMEAQRTQARQARQRHGLASAGELASEADWQVLSEDGTDGPPGDLVGAPPEERAEDAAGFAGYQRLELEVLPRRWRKLGAEQIALVLDRTPFYPEGGGQVADVGRLTVLAETSHVSANGATSDVAASDDATAGCWEVLDVQRQGGQIVHFCRPLAGDLGPPPGRKLRAVVDVERREQIARHHTATHLLHAALRAELGEHVTQAGSVVAAESLRFDYTHHEKPDAATLTQIERRINAAIRANLPLQIAWQTYEEATAEGALALFGEKYGERVRVVRVPGVSQELCGGCHVQATGALGSFRIVSEGSIARGVRRLVAESGSSAEERWQAESGVLESLKKQLNAPTEALPQKIEALLQEQRELERRLKALQRAQRGDRVDELLARLHDQAHDHPHDRDGDAHPLLLERVEVDSVKALRALADALRKRAPQAVLVLNGILSGGEKQVLLCSLPSACVARGKTAPPLINELAVPLGGRGGGSPSMATAGLPQAASWEALARDVPERVQAYLHSPPAS